VLVVAEAAPKTLLVAEAVRAVAVTVVLVATVVLEPQILVVEEAAVVVVALQGLAALVAQES